MDFKKIFPEKIHHGYIIESQDKKLVDDILNYFEINNFVNKNSLDVFLGKFDTFSIEDSLSLRDWYKNKPIENKNKVCIIFAKFLSKEAQESFLKILEEPLPSSYFIVITPNTSNIIPTLMSRVHYLSLLDNSLYYDVESFIKLKLKDRFDFVSDFIKLNKKEDDSGFLRDKAIVFLSEIEKFYYKIFQEKKDIKTANVLEKISKNKKYLNSPGASVKMILENISIII